MNVYVYRAALLCEQCGLDQRLELNMDGKAPSDCKDESSYDSDNFPKCPYSSDSNSSDSIQHCDNCHCFLEVDLTTEGRQSLLDMILRAITDGKMNDSMKEWIEFYEVTLLEVADYSIQKKASKS